ncbi:acyl transferase/acyl hydrolase/lysophospholipase [Leptodontidium sp. MPI-SDFR-AT-0119]|nr:acyl transferase/acyl hydrolase/lysophospholipase [Leptodontidium sp. MPI-SDFR-AT-0119]
MPDRRLRLLCLDGGGVRGLASLFMLKQILSHVGSPNPYEFFDMIGGTSTGGLIAIMLGRLHMSVDECILHYANIMDEIFRRKRLLPFSVRTGQISSRYATDVLEEGIKGIIEKSGKPREEKMQEANPRCKVFVVAVGSEGNTAVHFTNYIKPHEQSHLLADVKIWEAARATASAPTFFDPIKISCNGFTETFVDGALGHNNPVNELWEEAEEEFGSPLEPQILCILSLGTGKPALKEIGTSMKSFGETLLAITVETQRTALTFRRRNKELADNGGYFRFNPPDLQEVGLDESKKRGLIQQRCRIHGQDPDVEDAMKRFSASALIRKSPVKPIQYDAPVVEGGITFSALDRTPRYIKPGATSYWNHLTLEGYQIYEKIYEQCRLPKKTEGMVHIKSYLHQIDRSKVIPDITAIETWRRLLGPAQRSGPDVLGTAHPKAFVMAVLYMLHVEHSFGSMKPKLPDGEIGVEKDKREALKRFTKWVPCKCQELCRNEWNFANEVGLSRGNDEKCRITKFLAQGVLQNMFRSKELGWLNAMHDRWKGV